MTYTKKQFALELKSKVLSRTPYDEISKWAFRIYTELGLEFENGLDCVVLKLIAMEEGPEFKLTAKELYELADTLIADEMEEDLSKSIPEIKEVAKDLGDKWLMCPLCQEAWQNPHPQYAMTLCPKCNHKLHNPILKQS